MTSSKKSKQAIIKINQHLTDKSTKLLYKMENIIEINDEPIEPKQEI